MTSVPSVESPGQPVEEDVTYAFRHSMMGAPHAFRVAHDALYWHVGRYDGRIPYRTIRRIRLAFRPVSMQTHRFIAEIWSDNAPKLSVASVSRRGLMEQERQDAAYRAFVQALHQRIAETGATPVLQAGSSPWLYWPGLGLLAALALTFPVMFFRSLQAGTGMSAALMIVLLIVFLWQLGLFFWRNRPGTYRADAPPATLLPRG